MDKPSVGHTVWHRKTGLVGVLERVEATDGSI
jgi:hypothetical protein